MSTFLLGGLGVYAQQLEVRKGIPIITIFGDVGVGFFGSKMNSIGFHLERAYLGYDYGFNEHFHAKVVYDMGEGEDTKLQRLGYVKNAELDYKNGKFAIKFGLTSTSQFKFQEKFWSYRYVYKSFQDLNKWGSSADLGVSASYTFGSILSTDLSIFNGEGYKKIQADDQFLYGAGFTATLLEGFSLRFYGEMKTAKDTSSQYTAAFFAGYECKAFRVGAEYNMQLNHEFAEHRKLQGFSLYGSGHISDNFAVFVRYDYGSSSSVDAWRFAQDGNTFLFGIDYHNCNFISISPNVRFTQSAVGDRLVYACVSAMVNL